MTKSLKILLTISAILAIFAFILNIYFYFKFSAVPQNSAEIAEDKEELKKPTNAAELKAKLKENYIPPDRQTPKRLSPDLP